jgi:hypothetical protein
VAVTETAETLPPRDPDPSPVAHPVTRPAALLLRVTDEAGTPLEGAVVRVEARVLATDAGGDAAILDLAPATHAVTVSRAGYVDHAEAIAFAEGARVRRTVGLRARSAPVSVDAAAGATVEDRGFALSLAPAVLVDLAGQPFQGAAAVTLTGFDVFQTGLATLPAPPLQSEEGGEPVTHVPVAVFEASVTDAQGLPLGVAEGQAVEVLKPLPESSSLQPGDALTLRTLDIATGRWVEEPGATATVEDDGGQRRLRLALPHLSIWAVGGPPDSHVYCFYHAVDVGTDVELPSDLLQVYTELDLFDDGELHLPGGPVAIWWMANEPVTSRYYVYGASAPDSPWQYPQLPAARVDVQVRAGDAVVGHLSFAPMRGDPLSCQQMLSWVDPATVAPDHKLVLDLLKQWPVRGSGGRLRVTAWGTNNAPATGLTVRVTMGTGEAVTTHEFPMSGNLLLLQDLPAGDGTFVLLADDGSGAWVPVSGEVTFTIPDGCQDDCPWVARTARVAPQYAEQTPPPGGWPVPLCDGGDCDSCARATVQDRFFEAAAGQYVSFYEPVGQALATGPDGSVCVDVPGGADAVMLLSADHAAQWGSVLLPRGTACATGGCAEAAFLIGADSMTCPGGYLSAKTGKAREMGFLDPAYTADGVYPQVPANGLSLMYMWLRSDPGSDALAQRLPTESTLVFGATYGFQRVGHFADGTLFPEAGVFRHLLAADLGLSFEVGRGTGDTCAGHEGYVAFEDLGVGRYRVVPYPPPPPDPGDERPMTSVELVADWLGADGTSYRYSATQGDLEVYSRVPGAIDLYLEATFEPQAGTPGAAFRLLARPVTTLYAETDTPRTVLGQLSHPLNGAWFHVRDAAHSAVYGPSGPMMMGTPSLPCVPVPGGGEIFFCVPSSGWFMLEGEPIPGYVKPFSALQEVRDGAVTLLANLDPGAAKYVTLSARWFEREYVELLYARNSRPAADIDTTATIMGVAMRGGTPLADGFKTIKLVRANGSTLATGCHLRDDFACRTDSDSLSISTFAFLGVPPTTPDQPYTLRLYDRAGQEVPDYSQRIAPVAGGIMITHN